MRRCSSARPRTAGCARFGALAAVVLLARQSRDFVPSSRTSVSAFAVGRSCDLTSRGWGNSPAEACMKRPSSELRPRCSRISRRCREYVAELGMRTTALCVVFVLLSASGPIMFDWVKRAYGGRFPFSVPALTFHAWAFAALLGLGWTVSQGREGFRQLNRPDMLWRFCITTSLFTAGDMLSFMSIQHLDVGTFSLVGKALAIIITVVLSRIVLQKRQTGPQYALVTSCAAATVVFCLSEVHARAVVAGASTTGAIVTTPAAREWLLGLVERCIAVCLTSLGAVLQERLLTYQPGIPFLLQQFWMSCGAMTMSLFTLRCVHGLPFSKLVEGFGNWRVLLLLAMYVANGLAAGLMVKKLGAVAKALCVPIYLGGCYAYAVYTGSAALSVGAVLAWCASTACILLYAVSKATGTSWQRGVALPK